MQPFIAYRHHRTLNRNVSRHKFIWWAPALVRAPFYRPIWTPARTSWNLFSADSAQQTTQSFISSIRQLSQHKTYTISNSQRLMVILIITIITRCLQYCHLWQSQCDSSPRSLEWMCAGARYRTANSQANLQTWPLTPPVGCFHCFRPHTFTHRYLSITRPQSWQLVYHPSEGRRLSL